MKKLFTLIAAVLMLSASAETLSLYDGSEWSNKAPFNGMYLDVQGNKVQVLYPAADLTAMIGKQITGMTFYTDVEGCTVDGGLLNISLGETDATVMDGYITEGMTQVGTLTFTGHEGENVEISIVFDTPYTYNGGNLIFEDVVAQTTGYNNLYMLGVSTNYNNCVVTDFGMTFRQFLPKTTFTYGGDTPQPEVKRGDVNKDDTVNIADVTELIDMLLSGAEMTPEADCDLNGSMNIADVTTLIDYLLSGQW